MKGKFKIIVYLTLAIVCVGLFAVGLDFAVSLIGGSGIMVAVVGPGIDVTGAVSTEDVIAADLEENDLDRTIVKVRPSDTPLDTLLREIKNTQKVGSREIGGYEIGTKEIIDSTALAFAGGTDVANIKVANKSIYSLSDTILIPSVLGGDGKSLMLYVASMNKADSTIQVVAANPVANKVPAIPLNAEIHRLSNAMSETKAQTSAFSTLPTSRTNYTQIHMCQVEQTVLQGLQKMKVAMNFSTHKEMAIWEMKRRMEFTNLFGVKSKLTDPVTGEEIYTSDGIWNQITGISEYDKATTPNNKFFVQLTKEIFDGNNGSEQRVMLAGTDFIAYLSQIDAYAKQLEAKNVEVVHGVKFNRIITNFGELLVKSMTGLFVGQRKEHAIVIDPSYLRKDIYEALNVSDLDLDQTGQKRVKAQRLLENYGLFVENQSVHRKIMPKA